MYLRRRSTRSSLLTRTLFQISKLAWLRQCLRERSDVADVDRRVEQIAAREVRGQRSGARAVAAARRLVAIHQVIRVGEQLFVGVAVVGEDGGAGADAEAQPLAAAYFDLDL